MAEVSNWTLQILSDEAHSSVEFAVDSKGNVKPKVKVYDKDSLKALEQAKILMDEAIDYANSKTVV